MWKERSRVSEGGGGEKRDEEARSREETRANPEKHLATYLPTPLFIGLITALHTNYVYLKDILQLFSGLYFSQVYFIRTRYRLKNINA